MQNKYKINMFYVFLDLVIVGTIYCIIITVAFDLLLFKIYCSEVYTLIKPTSFLDYLFKTFTEINFQCIRLIKDLSIGAGPYIEQYSTLKYLPFEDYIFGTIVFYLYPLIIIHDLLEDYYKLNSLEIPIFIKLLLSRKK